MIAAMLMISFDDEDGPSIYRIDGYYRGVKVCAIFELLKDWSSFRCGFEEKSCQKQRGREAPAGERLPREEAQEGLRSRQGRHCSGQPENLSLVFSCSSTCAVLLERLSIRS